MENRIAGKPVVSDRHIDRLLDERGLAVVTERPAHHGFRIAVDDGRQINPVLPCRNVGNVADHLLIGCLGGEIPPHQIGDIVRPAVVLGEAEPLRPGPAGLQAQLAHEGAHRFGPAAHAPGGQVGMDPPIPVGAVRVVEGSGDEDFEVLAARTTQPGS
jgi:hypothetical protein